MGGLTMTDDGTRLHAAILANPAEDTPRLMYADWLDEQPVGRVTCPRCNGTKDDVIRDSFRFGTRFTEGISQGCQVCSGTGTVPDERQQRRAELIRLQCRPRPFPCECVSGSVRMQYQCPTCVGASRERELLAAHGAEWSRVECPTCKGHGTGNGEADGRQESGDCYDCMGTGDVFCGMHQHRNPQWSRGFVSRIECRTLAEVGGEVECENCGGDGEFTRRNSDGPSGPCPECGGKWNSGPHCDGDSYWDRGTGRAFRPAPWLAAVFRTHPIERVVVTDLEPYHASYVYRWSIADRDSSPRDYQRFVPPNWIPADLATALYPEGGFPTAEAARDALARAVADTVRESLRDKQL